MDAKRSLALLSRAGMWQCMHAAFDAAVAAIYRSASQPNLWPKALSAIATVFDDVGALLVYSRDDGSVGTIVSPGLEVAQREYEKGWWQKDIRFIRSRDRGYLTDGDTITDHDVVSDDEIASHPFYAEFLRPHGLGWLAGTAISPSSTISGALSVQRSHTKPCYTKNELELLTRLGRHTEAALRLGVELLDSRLQAESLSAAMQYINLGVFIVDELGTILVANDAARQALGDGLIERSDKLTHADAAVRDRLHAAIAAASRSMSSAVILAPATVEIRTLHVLPVGRGDELVEKSLSSARALVLVGRSDAAQPPDPSVVRDVLKLTLGEARVGALIGWGLTPRDASKHLGLEEETVRTVLKKVFSKVGVSRQSELVALLHRLLLR